MAYKHTVDQNLELARHRFLRAMDFLQDSIAAKDHSSINTNRKVAAEYSVIIGVLEQWPGPQVPTDPARRRDRALDAP
jgi:hypothetical protein